MNRKVLSEFTHNVKNFLNVENNSYKQWVFRYTFLELEKDLGTKGDITTNSIFIDKPKIKGRIIAKEEGVIAGLQEIDYFLMNSDPTFRSRFSGRFILNFKCKDGQEIKKGENVGEIIAELHDLLAVERVILNLLSRMSGVATYTKKIVNLVKEYNVLIVPTRKTLWGLLDKRAVSLGGGGTHRLNLTDAILVKDNHLDLINRDFHTIYERLKVIKPECRFVEIEVETKKEVYDAAKVFSANDIGSVIVLLMDNMKSREIMESVDLLKKDGLYEDVLLEASGGITEKNVLEYAKTGVDIISMGCLTGGVKGLDLTMEVSKV